MGRLTCRVPRSAARNCRRPMAVRTIRLFSNGERYPVCPRCRTTMEREYQTFCDRCGQRLLWSGL